MHVAQYTCPHLPTRTSDVSMGSSSSPAVLLLVASEGGADAGGDDARRTRRRRFTSMSLRAEDGRRFRRRRNPRKQTGHVNFAIRESTMDPGSSG